MGCLARLGCLIVLVVLCIAGWFTRDLWLPERFRSSAAKAAASGWQPATPAGATRARNALDKLSQPNGPVFQTVSAGDVASLAVSGAGRAFGETVDSVAAKVEGNQLTMRARVQTADLKGKLGPLASMFGEHEMVELSGTFYVVRSGLGAFHVSSARVGRLTVPQAMIPTLVKEIDGARRPEAMPANAVPLPIPGYVGDFRIANGKVNLYKNVK